MNAMIPNDDDFYKELHAAGRHYDTKLWAIPGAFVALQLGIFAFIDFQDIFGWRNIIISLSDIVFSLLICIQFSKDRSWQLLIQKKIDSCEKPARIPLYTVLEGKKELVNSEFDALNPGESWGKWLDDSIRKTRLSFFVLLVIVLIGLILPILFLIFSLLGPWSMGRFFDSSTFFVYALIFEILGIITLAFGGETFLTDESIAQSSVLVVPQSSTEGPPSTEDYLRTPSGRRLQKARALGRLGVVFIGVGWVIRVLTYFFETLKA